MPHPARRRARTWLYLGSAFLALVIGGALAFYGWLRSYLHGPDFQKFVAARLGETLQAEVECLPFRANGLELTCDGVVARGYEGSPFAEARMSSVKAKFSLRRVLSGVWAIESLNAEHLAVKLDGTRLTRPYAGEATPQRTKRSSGNGLLPNRIEVDRARLGDLELTWGESLAQSGAFRRTGEVQFDRVASVNGWSIAMNAGELTASGYPTLLLKEARLRYLDPQSTLHVDSASFTGVENGAANVSGEVAFGRHLDLRAQVSGLDLASALSGDWRLRLHGKMEGEVRLQTALPSQAPLAVDGSLRIIDGQAEALPILNQLAVITRAPQFRQLPLTRASGNFRRDGERLEVTNLIAESAGRMRLEGSFIVSAGEIDGTFQVGVPPSLIEWLPGAKEQVFTVARDGYLWAPMRLTGPVNTPTEDLSGRLIAAAGDSVLRTVEDTANDVLKRAEEAARSALDLLRPFVK